MLPFFKSDRSETVSRSQLYKKYNSYLNFVTILIIAFLVPYYYIQIVRYCVSKGYVAGAAFDILNLVFFYLIGSGFLIVGFLMVA
jgi:hypothetical protein